MASRKDPRSKLKRDRAAVLVPDEDGTGAAEPSIILRQPSRAHPQTRVVRSAKAGPELLPEDIHVFAQGSSLSSDEAADRVILGDAAAVLGALPEASIPLIITSPPYWNQVDYGSEGQIGQSSYESYIETLLEVWKACERVLIPNGKLCINTPIMPVAKRVMNEQHTRHLLNINHDIEASLLRATALKRFSLYIWQKQTTEKIFGSYPFPPNLYEQNTIEFITVFVKAGRPRVLPKPVKERSRIDARTWMDLTRQVWWLYPENVTRRDGHPAPFPETLPNRLIGLYSFRRDLAHDFSGDIVLDPFGGSGTSAVAARRLGRRYIHIDIDERFCRQAHQRLQAVTPDSAELHVIGR